MENNKSIDLTKLYNSASTTEESSSLAYSDIELAMQQEELESRKQDRKQRGKFSIWIFGFMGAYMLCILVVLVVSGRGVLQLSDTVLVSLLTTTTADVIGIFIIVAKYLFHKSEN